MDVFKSWENMSSGSKAILISLLGFTILLFFTHFSLLPSYFVTAFAAAGLGYAVWLHSEPEAVLAWTMSASAKIAARVAAASPEPRRRSGTLWGALGQSLGADDEDEDATISADVLSMSAQQVLETRYAVAAPIAAQLGNVCDWVVRDFVMNWMPLISPAEPSQFPKYLTHVIARAVGKLSVGILGVTVRSGGQHLRPSLQLATNVASALSFHVRNFSIMARRAQARCPQLFMPPPRGSSQYMHRLWAGAREVAIQHEYHTALADIATAGAEAVTALHHPGVYRDDVSSAVYAELQYAQAYRAGTLGAASSSEPPSEDAERARDAAVHPVDYLPTVLPAPAALQASVDAALDRHLQKLADGLLKQLIPPEDLKSPALQMVASDIVVSCVLRPLVDLLADPYTLNGWIGMIAAVEASPSTEPSDGRATAAGELVDDTPDRAAGEMQAEPGFSTPPRHRSSSTSDAPAEDGASAPDDDAMSVYSDDSDVGTASVSSDDSLPQDVAEVDAGMARPAAAAAGPDAGFLDHNSDDIALVIAGDEDLLRAFAGNISRSQAEALLQLLGPGHALLRSADTCDAGSAALVCSYSRMDGASSHLRVYKCGCAAGYCLQGGEAGQPPACRPGVCPQSLVQVLQPELERAGVFALCDAMRFTKDTVGRALAGEEHIPISMVVWPADSEALQAAAGRGSSQAMSTPTKALRGILRKFTLKRRGSTASSVKFSLAGSESGADAGSLASSLPPEEVQSQQSSARGYLAHVTGASGKLRQTKPAARGLPSRGSGAIISNVRPMPRAVGKPRASSSASNSPVAGGTHGALLSEAAGPSPPRLALPPRPSLSESGTGSHGSPASDVPPSTMLHNLRRLQHGSGVASLFKPSGEDTLRELGGHDLVYDFNLLRQSSGALWLDPPTVQEVCLLYEHAGWRLAHAVPDFSALAPRVAMAACALYTAQARAKLVSVPEPGLFGTYPDAALAPLPCLGIAITASASTRTGDERLCPSRSTAVRHTVEVWVRNPPPGLPPATVAMWAAILDRIPFHKRRWRLQYRYSEFVQLRSLLAKAGVHSKLGDVTAEAAVAHESPERLIFPGKRGPLTRFSTSRRALHMRRVGLQHWLRAVIAKPGLRGWVEVRGFLVPSVVEEALAVAFAGACAGCPPHLAAPGALASVAAWEEEGHARTLVGTAAGLGPPGPPGAPGPSGAPGAPARAGARRRTSLVTGSELGQLEFATFDVVSSVFDLSSANILRRGMLSAVRVVVRTFFSSTTAQAVRDVYRTATSLNTVQYWIDVLLESLWPGGQWPEAPEPLPTAEQAWKVRLAARAALDSQTPAALVSLLGKEVTAAGMHKLHDMVQCPAVLRSLALMLLDEVIGLVLPEMQVHDGRAQRFEVDKAWQALGEGTKSLQAVETDMTLGGMQSEVAPNMLSLAAMRGGLVHLADLAVDSARAVLLKGIPKSLLKSGK